MARRRGGRNDARGFANGIKEDLQDQIASQYGQLVRETINDLTKGTINGAPISPVLTGFFASSWKASTEGSIDQTDRREDYNPWAKMKRINVNGRTVLAPGEKPVQKVRHYIPSKLRITDTVYIGNTAKYTVFALQSPKRNIIPYLLSSQGLNAKINRIFSDKNKPKTMIGARADFSSGAEYDREVSYEQRSPF